MKEILLQHEGLEVFLYEDNQSLRMYGVFPEQFSRGEIKQSIESEFVETEIPCTGENQDVHHGNRHTGGNPGKRLIFKGIKEQKITPTAGYLLNSSNDNYRFPKIEEDQKPYRLLCGDY